MNPTCFAFVVFSFWAVAVPLSAQDLPGSKDPPGTKRYAGSEIIGYRAPKFDEFVLPLGPPNWGRPGYEKSLQLQGQISRYTYLAPMGRSTLELMSNYKLEFQRLGITTLYEKTATDRTIAFGPFFSSIEDEDGIKRLLGYNESDERVLVGKSKDAKPTYYCVFVTAARLLPWADSRLGPRVHKDQPAAEVIVISPASLEEKMEFVNAAEMSKSLTDAGAIALYGIYFDTDKDTLTSNSTPTLQEIVKLLKSEPKLRVHIVGHSDNQGTAAYNLDLSRRRAATVVRESTSKFGIAADRLDSFGCGPYAPVESNEAEPGRAKNRRVELVRW